MLAYIFVLLAVAVRFMPHPWAFTPVAACLLFFGARGSRKQLWFPLVMLMGSDLLLNKFVYAYPFTWEQLIPWAWYAGILCLGLGLAKHQKPLPLVGAALASSVSFFVVTNFAVWAFSGMYAKTWEGLALSFSLGIPFFRHSVEGDLLFTAAMFATPVAIKFLAQNFRGSHAAAA